MRSSSATAMSVLRVPVSVASTYKTLTPATSLIRLKRSPIIPHNTSSPANTPITLHHSRYYTTKTNKSKARMSHQKTAGPEGNKFFTRDHLFDLTGKVALVTGGGTGIGLMATQALATNGAKVYITSRNPAKLTNAAETYGGASLPGEIIPLQADLTSKSDIKSLVDDISSRENGTLDILINNAGVSSAPLEVESESAHDMRSSLFDDPEKTSFEDWTDTYRTNVAAAFYTTASFLPLLQRSTDAERGWSATVINISSISGMIKKSQHHFSYNASKAAAIHLNRMLAEEVAANRLKIRVNSIAPGVFPSEMTAKEPADGDTQKSELPRERYADKIPAGRPGKDEDMASAVLFFACNQYLNGQTLAVDGGYTLAAGL